MLEIFGLDFLLILNSSDIGIIKVLGNIGKPFLGLLLVSLGDSLSKGFTSLKGSSSLVLIDFIKLGISLSLYVSVGIQNIHSLGVQEGILSLSGKTLL
jgi:hypothetical protein